MLSNLVIVACLTYTSHWSAFDVAPALMKVRIVQAAMIKKMQTSKAVLENLNERIKRTGIIK